MKLKDLKINDKKRQEAEVFWGMLMMSNEQICENTQAQSALVLATHEDGSKWLVVEGLSSFQAWVREGGVGALGPPWSPGSLRSSGWTDLARWAFWPKPPGQPCGRPWWGLSWQSGTLWPPAWLHGRSWAWALWSATWMTAEKETDKSVSNQVNHSQQSSLF